MEYLTTARRLVNTVADWMAERKSSATKRKNKNVSRKLYSLYRYSNKVFEQDNKKVARGGGGPGVDGEVTIPLQSPSPTSLVVFLFPILSSFSFVSTNSLLEKEWK